MKSNKRQILSVTQPILKDLVDRQNAATKLTVVSRKSYKGVPPKIGTTPIPSPDLYQDDGGGYNPDFTYPTI